MSENADRDPGETGSTPFTPGIYVMRMGDNGYHLIGPFETEEAANNWAEFRRPRDLNGANPNNVNDDPRWQSITLADATSPPRVCTPDNTTVAAQWAEEQGYGK